MCNILSFTCRVCVSITVCTLLLLFFIRIIIIKCVGCSTKGLVGVELWGHVTILWLKGWNGNLTPDRQDSEHV